MFGPNHENARKWGGRAHSDANKNIQIHDIYRSRVLFERYIVKTILEPVYRPYLP